MKRISIIVIIFLVVTIGSFLEVRKRIFPQGYRQLVKQFSEKYTIDPLWIASVIFVESSFNPNAVSSQGAQGLMQIMPRTAREIARKIPIKLLDSDAIFVPAINIELGCWYITYLNKLFKDDLLALIAYNAGRGNLERWIKNNPDNGSFDLIEFPETKQYVRRVKRTYKILRLVHKIRSFF
ncbi:lytic transglycosylase domain-containing protein [Chlamydiota bacterium]